MLAQEKVLSYVPHFHLHGSGAWFRHRSSMMDAAAIQALVDARVAQVLAATAATRDNAGGSSGSVQIHKHYARLEKLVPEDWKEWQYQFGVATHAYCSKNGLLLEIVERMELDEVSTEALNHQMTQEQQDWMGRTQSEMFSVLSLLTKGEANQLVRSCEDKNGYTAWKKLYDRFNPKTPASLTAAWRDVIRPTKIKDMREAGKAIDAWESKVVELKKEHGEEPTTGLKASLLLEMLPDHVQLTVAQGMSSKKLEYDTLKAKIKLMANVQSDYSTPQPMDIGEMQCCDEDMNVEAVGVQKGKGKGPAFGTCWTCGGSHFARSCPKGNSKGPKGFGKGEEKGKGKGKPTGPMYGSCWTCGGNHFSRECPKGDGGGVKGGGKNSGKAMKCYNCGGFGHRAAQCPTSVREIEYDEEEEGHGDVESVSEGWDIFGLEEGRRQQRRHHCYGCSRQSQRLRPAQGDIHFRLKSRDPDVDQQTTRLGRWARGVGQRVTLRNRFEALQEEENVEEVDWIQWCAEDKEEKTSGKEEIVVDSGAAESVCPWGWASEFPIKEVAWNQKRNFRNASGGRMEHYGEKKVCCEFAGLSTPVNMKFQVSDARNPLASVARITEHGNIVQFGPKEEDNYIFNPSTEEKAMMRRKGRKFVLDASFIKKGSTFRGQA